jgi:hypothetical protein
MNIEPDLIMHNGIIIALNLIKKTDSLTLSPKFEKPVGGYAHL